MPPRGAPKAGHVVQRKPRLGRVEGPGSQVPSVSPSPVSVSFLVDGGIITSMLASPIVNAILKR